MRIVDVNGFYAEAGGGVRRYVEAKFLAAEAAAHTLVVIAPGEKYACEERPGGLVRWIPGPLMPFDPRYRRFADARAVRAALDAACPDIVEASSPWGSATIVAGWSRNAAKSLIFHQDVVAAYGHTALDGLLARSTVDALAWPWWARLRRLSKCFDVTVAGGGWLAQRLAARGIANARNVSFGLESGCFGHAHRDPELRAALLARCGASPGGKLLLAVSRFHPEKRLPMVILAFARARRVQPDLGLVVVGDGLARRSVERAARRAPGAILLGPVSDRSHLARLLASADLFVHGSAAETYGLATAEAIASGLAVVTPDYGGAADLARRGHSLTYRTGDPEACAAAILEALAGRTRPPTAPGPAGLRAHFSELFSVYESLVRPAR